MIEIVENQPPRVQGQAGLVELVDQAQIVAGDQHGDADLIEIDENLHDLTRQHRVEVAGRLIGEQQHGFVYHGAGDADALLLATGKGNRHRFLLVQQAHLVQRRARSFGDFLRSVTLNLQGQGDVFENRSVEKQLVVLENDADIAAQVRNALTRDSC